MNPTKADKLTAVSLAVFRLNGQLLQWGDDFCQPHDLTSARWQVLGAIAMAISPPSVPQIASAMGVTRQGVQKQIDLLLGAGQIRSQPNPGHKRSLLYALTKNGGAAYREIHQRWQKHVQALARDFSAADLEATIRVLQTLSNLHAKTRQES